MEKLHCITQSSVVFMISLSSWSVEVLIWKQGTEMAIHHCIILALSVNYPNPFHIVELLMDQGGSNLEARNNRGDTPLHLVCGRCLIFDDIVERARLLLDRGASLQERNNDGYTPLHIACLEGDLSAVRLLLDRGASSEARDRNDMTSLDIACSKGKIEVDRLLLDLDADLETTNHMGCLSLHFAALNSCIDVALLLL